MTLKKISKQLEITRELVTNEGWDQSVFFTLLFSIAEHLLEQDENDCEDQIPVGYITLSEFEDKYKFIAKKTLGTYCNQDVDFSNTAPIKYGSKWYIDAKRTVDFFKKVPTFKRRMANLK